MKITLKFINPINPSNVDEDEFFDPYEECDSIIPFNMSDEDENSDGSSTIVENFQEYFLDSNCTGINFKKICEKNNIDINKYYKVSSYDISKSSLRLILKEMIKYPWIRVIPYKGDINEYFNSNSDIPVYEFSSKTSSEDMIVFIGPEEEKYNAKFLFGNSYYKYEFEISSEKAIDFIFNGPIYISSKSDLEEICDMLLKGEIPNVLKETISRFIPGKNIAMWEWSSISGRNVGVDFEKTPWKLKLKELRDKVDKIYLRKDICLYKKLKLIKNLLRG